MMLETTNNTSNNSTETGVKSIKEISLAIKNLLEDSYPYVWLRGEVGSLTKHSSGHKYFALKEEEYVINAVNFKTKPLTIDLNEGEIIECYGKITAYGNRSYYQIIVYDARKVNQLGNILQQLEELKKKLAAEGLFDLAKKKPIPKYPNTIAILTSPTGAVLHDIMNRITHRYPCCHIYFFPIPVQGSESEKAILAALEKVNEMKDKIDLAILARGGGSIEDLWVFNSEAITRSVANMQVPIISAIGHETDTTLVDYASDLRAPTPTAAAEIASPDKHELKNMINTRETNIAHFAQEKIKKYKDLLDSFKDYNYLYINAIGNFGQKIDNIILNFVSCAMEKISKAKIELGTLESPIQLLEKFKQKITEIENITTTISNMRMKDAMNLIDQQKMFLAEKEVELKEKILIVDDSRKKITSANDLKALGKFAVQFFDGSVHAHVDE